MAEIRSQTRSRQKDSAAMFRDAALLLWRCAGYWFDLQERRDGWQIHYAVDIDIITSYTAPETKKRYGVVLSEDDALAETLIRMLGEFIMRDLAGSGTAAGGKGSLLIVSPHDEELDRMLLALHHKLAEHVEHAPKQLELASLMVKQGATDEELGDYLLKHANQLTQAMRGRAQEEVDRFARLTPNRLLNSLRLQLHSDNGEVFRLPSPPEAADDPAHADYARRYGDWKEALERQQSGDKPEHSIRRDARVLATLEWTNEQLAQHKHRLVMITGSRNIFDAEQDLFKRKGSGSVSGSFGAKYLRHLHACLGDEAFFITVSPDRAGPAAPEFRVFDWLNLMFPTYIDKRGDSAAPRLDAIHELLQSSDEHWQAIAKELPLIAAYKANQKDPSAFIGNLVQRWTDQVRSVAVERGVALATEDPKSQAAWLVGELRQHVGSDWTEAGFRTYLSERASRSLARLYKATTYLGVLALRDGDSRIHGVPSLRFDPAFAAAQQICTAMQEMMFSETAGIDLGALYAELREIDPDDYHSLVIHAFAYAIRGHWFGTLTLCHTALEVVESIGGGMLNGRDGREAHYLLAIARRRLADKPADLEASLATLETAARLHPPHARPDPRFASERIANRCAQLYLTRFPKPAVPGPAPSALHLLEAELQGGLDLLDALTDEPLLEVCSWVTRQTFTNLLSLALLAELDATGSVLRLAEPLHGLTDALRERRLAPDLGGVYSDIESDVVYWAAAAVFSTSGDVRREAARQLDKLDITAFGSERDRIAAFCELARSRSRQS